MIFCEKISQAELLSVVMISLEISEPSRMYLELRIWDPQHLLPRADRDSGQTYGSLGPQFPTQASLMAQRVKNLPAVQETQVWFLGWEDPLEKGVATHSSILAWRIPLTKEPGGLQFIGSQRVRRNWATNTCLTKSTPIINGVTSSQDGPTSKHLTHGNFEWWASEINHSFL